MEKKRKRGSYKLYLQDSDEELSYNTKKYRKIVQTNYEVCLKKKK